MHACVAIILIVRKSTVFHRLAWCIDLSVHRNQYWNSPHKDMLHQTSQPGLWWNKVGPTTLQMFELAQYDLAMIV